MRSPIFNKAMKDMAGTLRKVVEKKKGFLNEMSGWQQQQFYDTLLSYSPQTEKSIDDKKQVLMILEEKLGAKNASFLTVGERIAEKSCVLQINIKQPGFRRKIGSEHFLTVSGNNGDVDASILHVAQDIIARSEVKDLKTHRSGLLNYIRGMEVPGGMLSLGNGQHLIPLAYVEQIKERIEKFKTERQEKIDAFEARYPQVIKDAKKNRGKFFKEEDYPDFQVIREKYQEHYRFISNNVPEELAKVSQRVYEEEKQRIHLQCAAEASNIRDALRSSWSGIVEHYVDSLSGVDEDTGKPKKFYESGTTRLKDFIKEFKDKDLTDDEDLQLILGKAEDLLNNAVTDKIRSDEEFRSSLATSFAVIKQESDALIVTKARKFDLD